MTRTVALELIVRLDINAALKAAGRELTETDRWHFADLLYLAGINPRPARSDHVPAPR